MHRMATMARTLIALIFLVSLLTPITAYQALAEATEPDDTFAPAEEAPPTGTLQIQLTAGDTGLALGGACFDVTDADAETRSACDHDFDGLVVVGDLPVGVVSVRQTTPANSTHAAEAHNETEIVAGELVTLRLTNDPYPPAPSEPVAEEEPAAEEDPIVEEEIVTDDEPAVEDETVTDDEPAVEDETVTDDEPAVEDETVIEDEPTAEDETVTDDEPAVEEESAADAETTTAPELAPESATNSSLEDAPLQAPDAGFAAAFTLADETSLPYAAISVAKSCPTFPDGYQVGAPISFAVTITNTGDVALENVSVLDYRDGSFDSAFPNELDPGESATRFFLSNTNVFEAEDRFIFNAVDVWADPVEWPDDEGWDIFDWAEVFCLYEPEPEITVTAGCPAGLADKQIGDSIFYEVTITNSGETPLIGSWLSSDRSGGFASSPPFNLPPGASFTTNFSSGLTPTDALNGHVNNIFIAAADSIGRHLVDSVTVECPFAPAPRGTIDKLCPGLPNGVRVGQTVAFPVYIVNMGEVPLTGIVVNESREGVFHLPFPTTLAPGHSATRLFLTAITLEDAEAGSVSNSATLTADGLVPSEATTAAKTCGYQPWVAVTITKQCPDLSEIVQVPHAGAEFPVTVTNTGDLPLSNILVQDTRAGSWEPPGFPDTLAPGASVTVNFISDLTDEEGEIFSNTALVSAESGSGPVFDQTGITCRFFEPYRPLTITKTCVSDLTGARVGDPVEFEVTITASGESDLVGIAVTDFRPDGEFDEAFPTELDAGESATRTFTGIITYADAATGGVYNEVEVGANDAQGNPGDRFDYTAEADAVCSLAPVHAISITKTCPSADDLIGAELGFPVTFRMTLENTGDLALTGINFFDDRPGNPDGFFPFSLDAGAPVATMNYTVYINEQDLAAGNVTNTATVTTNEGAFDTVVATCALAPAADISIQTFCPSFYPVDPNGSVRIGDPIVYHVTVTNTGKLPLTDVSVTELRDGSFNLPFPTTLLPGQAVIRLFTGSITAADAIASSIDNSVTASAKAGALVVSDEVSASCSFHPYMSVAFDYSCPDTTGLRVGDEVTFQIVLTNNGDVPFSAIELFDGDFDGIYGGAFTGEIPETLAPGDSFTIAYTRPINSADAAGSFLRLLLEFTALAPSEEQYWNVFGIGCDYEPFAEITITKACPTTLAGAGIGASISYAVRIQNTGDVTLHDIVVTDERDGSFTEALPEEFTLVPGESIDLTFVSQITVADAIAGHVNNTVSVTSVFQSSRHDHKRDEYGDDNDYRPGPRPGSVVVDATRLAECPFSLHEEIEIIKSCPETIPPNARVGDAIVYSVTITNRGVHQLTGIVVEEERAGSFSSPFPTTLGAGQSATRTFTSVITEEDAQRFNVDNSASVTAAGLTGPVSDSVAIACSFSSVVALGVSISCPHADDLAGKRVGDPVVWEIDITNDGDVTLILGAITPSRTGTLSDPTEEITVIPPGETISRSFTAPILSADAASGSVDLDVLVTAAYGPAEAMISIQGNGSAACSFTPITGLEVSITCPTLPEGFRVGQSAGFGVTITNTGDRPVFGIVVSANRAGSLVPLIPEGAIGVGLTYTGIFVTTVTDIDADIGSINALFNVSSAITDAEDVSLACAFSPVSVIEIVKACPQQIPVGHGVGDTITYTITLTNPGDAAHVGILVTDSRDGTLTGSIPGAFLPTDDPVTLTFTTTITEADIAAGAVANTATVTTSVPSVTDSSTAECALSPGAVEITKTGDGAPLAGACFELTGAVNYGPACTDEAGFVRFSGVQIGSYILSETTTPDGFVTISPLPVEIGHAETVQLALDNEVATGPVTVFSLDCAADPGTVDAGALQNDPAFNPDGCVRSAGVSFTLSDDAGGDVSLAAFSLAAVNSFNNPYVTGANGSFSEQVLLDSTVVITQDGSTVTPGYAPRENPITLAGVQGGEIVVFVNLAQDGALKLRKLVCKVDKARPVKFELLAGGFGAIAAHCWRGNHVAFTISGGDLSAPLTVRTDRHGMLAVELNAGRYTLTEAGTGASTTFTVTANETTRLQVTNYKVKPEEVKELPDTGAGPLEIAGGNDWLLALLSLGLAGFAAAGLTLRAQRRPRMLRMTARH